MTPPLDATLGSTPETVCKRRRVSFDEIQTRWISQAYIFSSVRSKLMTLPLNITAGTNQTKGFFSHLVSLTSIRSSRPPSKKLKTICGLKDALSMTQRKPVVSRHFYSKVILLTHNVNGGEGIFPPELAIRKFHLRLTDRLSLLKPTVSRTAKQLRLLLIRLAGLKMMSTGRKRKDGTRKASRKEN
jgi:hypothetical protein